MRILKILLIVVAIAIVVILALALRQPDTYLVQRSTMIQAPPEKVYAILEDFGRSPEWSPYEKKDPNMKRTRSGPEKGKGAVYAFEGNKEVGTGRLTMVDAVPPNKLVIRLDMIEPMAMSNTIEYTLVPQGSGTQVTWAMRGGMPFISKVMCVFIDIDKMIGKDFETGLAALKAVAEK